MQYDESRHHIDLFGQEGRGIEGPGRGKEEKGRRKRRKPVLGRNNDDRDGSLKLDAFLGLRV